MFPILRAEYISAQSSHKELKRERNNEIITLSENRKRRCKREIQEEVVEEAVYKTKCQIRLMDIKQYRSMLPPEKQRVLYISDEGQAHETVVKHDKKILMLEDL